MPLACLLFSLLTGVGNATSFWQAFDTGYTVAYATGSGTMNQYGEILTNPVVYFAYPTISNPNNIADAVPGGSASGSYLLTPLTTAVSAELSESLTGAGVVATTCQTGEKPVLTANPSSTPFGVYPWFDGGAYSGYFDLHYVDGSDDYEGGTGFIGLGSQMDGSVTGSLAEGATVVLSAWAYLWAPLDGNGAQSYRFWSYNWTQTISAPGSFSIGLPAQTAPHYSPQIFVEGNVPDLNFFSSMAVSIAITNTEAGTTSVAFDPSAGTQVIPVPEPGTLILLNTAVLGLGCVLCLRRRRRRAGG
jgi:hypothetical protein